MIFSRAIAVWRGVDVPARPNLPLRSAAVSDPFDVSLVDYVNTRNFSGSFNFATAGDLGPEALHFISADDSPNGKPLLVAAHEGSGSTVIYQVNKRASKRGP